MIALEQGHAEFLIGLIFWSLLALFVFLAVFTTVRRRISARNAASISIATSEMEPLLHQYLFGEKHLTDMETELRSRFHIVAAFRLISPMIDNFLGIERERLQQLLEIPAFSRHFERKLRSRRASQQAHACVYYAQRKTYNAQATTVFLKLVEHPYAVLAYSATLALLNHPDLAMRRHGLFRFLARKRNSAMAIHDIVVKYAGQHPDKMLAAQELFDLAMHPSTPPRSAGAMLLLFSELGFFHLIEPLFDALVMPKTKDHSGRRLAALITVLSEMAHPQLLQAILDHKWHESSYRIVQLAVIHAFSQQTSHIPPEVVDAGLLSSDAEIQYLATRLIATGAG